MLSGMNLAHNQMAIWSIDNHLKPAQNHDILDIGCGGGQNIANLLLRTKGRVYGIDYSPASVAKSLRRNRKAVENGRTKVIEAEVSHIPFDDETFDIVTAFETIYFWSDLENDFREVMRVLRPGGRFMICNEATEEKGNELWIKTLGLRIYTPEEITTHMQQVGFQQIRQHRQETSQRMCVVGVKNDSGKTEPA